jgi:hypothetical protein
MFQKVFFDSSNRFQRRHALNLDPHLMRDIGLEPAPKRPANVPLFW